MRQKLELYKQKLAEREAKVKILPVEVQLLVCVSEKVARLHAQLTA